MNDKIAITVDGRPCEAEKGDMLLKALQRVGVHVPTLCHHPSLEPSGACRLCVVEITRPEWKGWSNLVTSCMYPAAEGLQISTLSPRVREARRTLLELYVARCPDSEQVRSLARSEGVDVTRFPPKEEADLCVLCGLCTRVCQDLGPSAIAPLSRGSDKQVGPRPDRHGEDCTGCGACARICPTGEIRMEHKDEKFRIWNRDFPIPVCKVEAERCIGCGVCEEVCPLDIPRITLFKNGNAVSQILASACIGCGICAGACPTGAIKQDAFPAERMSGEKTESLKGKSVIFACSRTPLPEGTKGVIAVPCIGRVSLEQQLSCLARGADGVLLMCRDQATCTTGEGGALAEARARVADELAASAGLGAGRIQYVKPKPGLEGPAETAAAFRVSLEPSPLASTYAGTGRGMDHALEILAWLREQPELTPALHRSLVSVFTMAREDGDTLRKNGDTLPEAADTLLYLGDLADLDLLFSLTAGDQRLTDVLTDAARLLEQKGMAFKPVLTAREVNQSKAGKVVTFSRNHLPDWNREIEVITLDELAGTAAKEGADPFHFHISQNLRKAYLEKLKKASGHLVCACPHELALYRMLMREGAWHQAFYQKPCLAFSQGIEAKAGEAK